ncbi:hypothetical protein BZA05DRAFT_451508 [Tricharina praecox]|uniref:uncharacterized protein n=1 Tax=Tricharina praecox TaxID=43433 RepID=UPI00221FF63E|nr:uncharacterized protein BZA05DRAFT_451508 [Tricharina praecox]KAI5853366.1 hypothetical protein BZA05DRAFT_451508 [Tricharina praecox]
MAPRRSHKKSRTGCQKCKRRRIKCDEVHPSCGNCLKHAIICDFSLSPEEQRAVSLEFQSAPRAAAGGQAKSSSSSAASPLLLPPPPPPPPQLQQHSFMSSVNLRIPTAHPPTLNVLDLSLMHHWSIYTVDSMSNRDHIQQIWRLNVPTLAVHHPFLMHALLAISAMHLHYKGADPSESSPYLSVASHHHECAVRGMAGCLAHISRDNCDALFIASSLVVIYSFVASRIDEVPTQIASWVPLIRGVHSILKQAWSWVNSGPLSPLFTQYDRSPSSEGLDPETESVIQSLYRLCTDRTLPGSNELSDIATSTAYFSAIAELRRTFATISAWGSIIGSIFVWPVTANDKYVELLVERRPRALVIFMHYCALFSLVEEFWWSQGSALFELRRCEQCLADEWLPWIEWPRLRILAGDLSVVVGGGRHTSSRLV